MLDVIVLSFALSSPPVRTCRTDEPDEVIQFCSETVEYRIANREFMQTTVTASTDQKSVDVGEFHQLDAPSELNVSDTFRKLSSQWSVETSHVTSVSKLTAHPSYQAIIKLGWEVVPLMLQDLQENRGFWYPALSAITGIRPFDEKAAGNSRLMTRAWLDWGRKKGLI